MPQLTRILTEEDLARHGRVSRLDLSPYIMILDTVREGGVGGVLELEAGENQRATKRRLSLAAKERGWKLVWRKADEGQLRFVLADQGQPTPGGRPRRQPEAEPEPQSNGRRRRRGA